MHVKSNSGIQLARNFLLRIILAIIGVLYVSAALRICVTVDYFDSISDTLFFTLLSFTGSSPWNIASESGIGSFIIVLAFLILHFLLYCGFVSWVVSDVMRVWVRSVGTLSKRWSSARSSISIRVHARLDSDESRSWLKSNLPGWYYRVTIPNRIFRKKVTEAEDEERNRKLQETHLSELQAGDYKNALSSLHEVSQNFTLQLKTIQVGMRKEINVLDERLREVYGLLTDVTDRLVAN
jgi:hypothetical protein